MFTTYKMTHPLSMSLFLSIFMKYFLPFKIGLLLSVDQLKDEISILERSLQVRNQLQALRNYEQGKNSVCFHVHVTVHFKKAARLLNCHVHIHVHILHLNNIKKFY